MSLNIDQVRSRLTNLQTQTTKQDSFWKPPAGKSVIRILPYKFNKENPFIELLFHYNFGGKSYLSPKTFGRPDPVVEFAEKLRATGDKENYKIAKSLEPKLRTFVPIIVRGEENKGAKFWGFGKTVYQDLLEIIASDFGDITDIMGGRDVTVDFKTAEETGKSFPSTKILVKADKTPITENKSLLETIFNSQKDILTIYKEPSYEDLKTVLENWLNPDNQEKGSNGHATEEAATEAPAAPSKKATVVKNMAQVSSEFDDLFKK